MLDFLLDQVLRTTKAHLEKLQKMGIKTIQDLLEFFPRDIESTEITSQFIHIQMGAKNTLSGKLVDFRKEKTPRGKILGKAALILDDGSVIDAIWFQIPYLLKNIREETNVFLIGKIERKYGKVQILNPEVHFNKNVHLGKLRAIYPESPPITSKWLREKISGIISFAKEFPEILPNTIIQNERFLPKQEAIKAIHNPLDVAQWHEARRRLGFEEIFEIQMRVMREKVRREAEITHSKKISLDAEQTKKDLTKIPFSLTVAQKKCLYQILKDFEALHPMHRLMQGDVGSGKTIVAFLAALPIVRAGWQVVFLAPTEILAKQHFENALRFFNPDFSVELLTGSVTSSNKKKIKSKLKNGDIHILIGTHAVLTPDTEFQDLGFVVIDEQHRFGVEQRDILAQSHAHVLAMTATPIPRTLALTIYGDQDISIIDQLPPGRKPIITRVVADTKTIELCNRFIDDQVEKQKQVFWICPLIDESDAIEAKNVKSEFDRIAHIVFPSRRVEFLHGKMKIKEKDSIMRRFRAKEFDILVSTSVIEVGVDIPDATIMVIENSERFGLSQLHQFRGRIGRNSVQSYCFLMVGNFEDKNKTRLRAMEQSNDGRYLAEIDLKLRGMGELYGTRQSGLPDFRCADISNIEMLQSARDWAITILKEDTELQNYPLLKKHLDEGAVYF
jgi:ATP-dependent DNA helicase RecG